MTWLEHPDAVRELLSHTPQESVYADRINCPACGAESSESHGRCELPHDDYCPIAAAWRAIGDPRGAEDFERAHEEALADNRDRIAIAAQAGNPVILLDWSEPPPICVHRWLRITDAGAICNACGVLVPGVARRL